MFTTAQLLALAIVSGPALVSIIGSVVATLTQKKQIKELKDEVIQENKELKRQLSIQINMNNELSNKQKTLLDKLNNIKTKNK